METRLLVAGLLLFTGLAVRAQDADPVKSCTSVWTSGPPPRGVAEWATNKILNDPRHVESRFVDYDKQAALKLIADATAQRSVESEGGAQGQPRRTSFSMMYNAEGWYVYIRSDEPQIEEIRNANGAGESLEVFFSPGLGHEAYYMLMIDLAGNKVTEYTVGSPNRHFRSLEGHMKVETIALPDAWGTMIFIPWECLYDKLPINEEVWRFSIVRWMPFAKCGGVSWSGKVHETGKWGQIKWEKPAPANLLAMQKHLIRRAWKRYQAQLATARDFWNEKELERDAEFFRSKVEPVAQQLGQFEAKLKTLDACDAETVAQLYAQVPAWMEFRYTVDELRRDYLLDKLCAQDGKSGTPPAADAAPLTCYAVPAVSSVQRLPDRIPEDGKPGAPLQIVAAQGEHAPASFVVVSRANAGKLELQPAALTGASGTLPADCVDVKVVKCWYQGGTAWYSYFGDPSRRVLVPELLLNDETLIKVDTEKQDNYLRMDYPEGSKYVCVSYSEVAPKTPKFNYAKEPVKDSPVLCPISLQPKEARQFWVTVRVPEKAAAGTYQGKIGLTWNGQACGAVALNLCVLPFALPAPKTYYDLRNDYYTLMMHHCSIDRHMTLLDNDIEQAEARARVEYRNMLEHNLSSQHMRLDYNGKNKDVFLRQLKLMKEVGFRMQPLFGGGWASANYAWMNKPKGERDPKEFEAYKKRMDETFDLVEQVLGHRDLYCNCWDEAGKGTLRGQQDCWRYVHEKGGRIWATSNPSHFLLVGHAEDVSDSPGISRDKSVQWHAVGGRVMMYATPHTGPENPDLFRRTHGLQMYKAHCDGTFNYIWYEGGQNIWNDFTNKTFRCFNMVYPTQNGVIDTLAWEGFREAIGDIRYATQMKMLAEKAIASGHVDARYTGKRALQWLEWVDEKTADLNTVRLEMVNYILELQRLAGQP